MPKKLTKEQQIEKANKIHNFYYSYEKFEYVNSVTKSTVICPLHGDFEMTMSNHTHKTKPQGCKRCNHYINKEYIVQQGNLKHNGFYSYDLVREEVSSTSLIEVICPLHGSFKIIASKHYSAGKGCKLCSKIGAPKKRDEYYIKKLEYFHYPILTELKDICSTTVLKAFCTKHGVFNITAHHAISKRNCPKCAKEKRGVYFSFSRTGFKNACIKNNSGLGIFYIIRCFNENEEFYKIGITSRSIKERYAGKQNMPYQYKIIQEIQDNPENIYNFELLFKNKAKNFKYKPSIYFPGHTECYMDKK